MIETSLSPNVLPIIYALIGSSRLLFILFFLISVYGAYEFSRRFRALSPVRHPETRRLFNNLRFLFLFISVHHTANILYLSLPHIHMTVYASVAILHVIGYIGAGIAGFRIVTSTVFIIGHRHDNSDHDE